MAAVFYNKITLFHNQTVSPLLLFHVNGASERNVIPATKRGATLNRAIETRWSTVYG